MEMPKIHLIFDCETVEWRSENWGHDSALMAKAKKAINEGRNPTEVVDLLAKAGFFVIHNAWDY